MTLIVVASTSRPEDSQSSYQVASLIKENAELKYDCREDTVTQIQLRRKEE